MKNTLLKVIIATNSFSLTFPHFPWLLVKNWKFRLFPDFPVGWQPSIQSNRVWIHSEMCTWHDNNIQSISYTVCKSMLFKITWNIYMTFLHWKNHKKYSILLKITFEIPFFLIKKLLLKKAAFNYYKYSYYLHDQQISQTVSHGHICFFLTYCFQNMC